MTADALQVEEQPRRGPDGLRVELGDWDRLGEHAARVRRDVFVREQAIPAELEWDEWDPRSAHCVVFDGDTPVATGRLLPDAHVGRMAVLRAYRRTGVGGRVLKALVRVALGRGERLVRLNAQAYVQPFYERHGFAARGEHFVEAGIDHVEMVRALAPREDAVPARVATRTVTMPDSATLHQHDWTADRARGHAYVLHGLGEHAGRYDALARWLCARGWNVRAHDHVGHGRSSGRRGTLRAPEQIAEHAQRQLRGLLEEAGGRPVLLFGHSLGGSLAAELVLARGVPVAGLVLSSPALALGLARPQRALLAFLEAVAPSLAVPNGIDPALVSHDAAAVRAYREDPLVHRRVSARLLRWLIEAGEGARRDASALAVPTLLAYAADDRLVSPAGSVEFARRAPRSLLTVRRYDGLYHEILNEAPAERERVLRDLGWWLDASGVDA